MDFGALYRIFAPVLVAAAGAVLTVQQAMGVSHPTIAGTIAGSILSLLGAHAVYNAHQDGGTSAG